MHDSIETHVRDNDMPEALCGRHSIVLGLPFLIRDRNFACSCRSVGMAYALYQIVAQAIPLTANLQRQALLATIRQEEIFCYTFLRLLEKEAEQSESLRSKLQKGLSCVRRRICMAKPTWKSPEESRGEFVFFTRMHCKNLHPWPIQKLLTHLQFQKSPIVFYV